MSIYPTIIAIIATVFVITQIINIIRITQNYIQLCRQEKEIKKALSWIEDNDISERDFQTQMECFYLLRDYLKKD